MNGGYQATRSKIMPRFFFNFDTVSEGVISRMHNYFYPDPVSTLAVLQYKDARDAVPGDLVSTKSYMQYPFMSCAQDEKRLQEG